MKPLNKQYEYYRVKSLQSDFTIEFESLKEMLRFAEKNVIKSVFILPGKHTSSESFAFTNKGGLLKHETEGYQSLEEYKYSSQNGFPDSKVFYEACKLGFDRYDEYKMSTETGITDAKEYEEIKKEGFIEAYSMLDNGRKENPDSPQLEEIKNAYQLREWVANKKFESAEEFSLAWKGGFAEPLEYREATTKEYKTRADYKTGSANGFTHGENYYFAKERGIENFEELVLYTDLEAVKIQNATFDQKVICILISKMSDNKKTSVNKLYEGLQETKTHYFIEGNIPAWFTMSINNVKDLVQFLAENEYLKKYGHYDTEGEYFQNKKLQERTVILDGSNVAYGKQGDKSRRPTFKNILTMVKFLTAKGFPDIHVFTDAASKHRLTDIEHLPELQKLSKFSYTPAETPADLFLITYVKQNHCLLVSNDKFRDWKIQDPWVATNIDYYKMTFMIEDDKVLMPDLE